MIKTKLKEEGRVILKEEGRGRNVVSPLRGITHIDYIVAIGIFILLFAFVVQALISNFQASQATSEIEILTGRAFSFTSIADFGFEPGNWSGTENVSRIGLQTRAYRFYIAVNNTAPFLRNQSDPVRDITNEIIRFNYSDIGYPSIDINSTYIYDGSSEVPYNISGQNISFRTNINQNQVKVFTVYFDDDSNFTSRSSAAITGTDNLTETLHAVQIIPVMQFRKIQVLNSSSYANAKTSLNSDDFNITIQILGSSPARNILSYGGEVPRSGNLVAMQRYVIFQNSTAGVLLGKMIIRTW